MRRAGSTNRSAFAGTRPWSGTRAERARASEEDALDEEGDCDEREDDHQQHADPYRGAAQRELRRYLRHGPVPGERCLDLTLDVRVDAVLEPRGHVLLAGLRRLR